ncbi:MAG: selenide, water dikinase SelD [Bacteroidales bacterium]|nr:selenide, water dikinase SelD [Bacteroidales bacterium]
MPEHQENNITHSASIKNIKLTHYTHGLGCACKIEPRKLEEVLQLLPSWSHPDILVGTETSDDATVYRINDSTAIVQTLDFFTPIADDPYDFGAIAAANALSDIYAMGAVPLFALNIVGFPENQLPMEVLHQILKGAQEKAAEAGIGVLGGHSIEDPEPKFGMVVTGIVDPQKVIKNYGALPGDCLILTKPLGLGILTTAIKRGLVEVPTEKKAMEVMKTLNKAAAELMLRYKVHACTDVTGFGLLGHLYEMTKASKCNISLTYDHIPIFPEATSLATAGVIPGGTHKNHAFIKNQVNFNHHPLLHQMLLSDAQTSGGLLIAMPASEAEQYVHALNKTGNHDAAVIGVFTEAGEGKISIL